MAVFIREVISELVLDAGDTESGGGRPTAESGDPRAPGGTGPTVDDIVRRASERVLEQLRREWDR